MRFFEILLLSSLQVVLIFVFLLVLGAALLLCIYIILKALKVNDYVENK